MSLRQPSLCPKAGSSVLVSQPNSLGEMHVVHSASTAHTGLAPLASITPGATSVPGLPQSSSGKVGESNHFREQGGWIRVGHLLRKQVLGSTAWALLLGPRWDRAYMLRGVLGGARAVGPAF